MKMLIKSQIIYQETLKNITKKGLTKYLINKNSILNGEIYFFSDKLQNYLV